MVGRWLLATAWVALAAAPARAEDIEALRDAVRPVFEQHCVKCHQEDPAVPNRKIEKFGYILDFERLEASKYVVPGEPEKSEMYTSVKTDKMPEFADLGMTAPVPDEGKEAIRAWIAGLGK